MSGRRSLVRKGKGEKKREGEREREREKPELCSSPDLILQPWAGLSSHCSVNPLSNGIPTRDLLRINFFYIIFSFMILKILRSDRSKPAPL